MRDALFEVDKSKENKQLWRRCRELRQNYKTLHDLREQLDEVELYTNDDNDSIVNFALSSGHPSISGDTWEITLSPEQGRAFPLRALHGLHLSCSGVRAKKTGGHYRRVTADETSMLFDIEYSNGMALNGTLMVDGTIPDDLRLGMEETILRPLIDEIVNGRAGSFCELPTPFRMTSVSIPMEAVRDTLEMVQLGTDVAEIEKRNSRRRTMDLTLVLVAHAADCDGTCGSANCARMKIMFDHCLRCEERRTCNKCRGSHALIRLHAQRCTSTLCNVPFCMDFKIRMGLLDEESSSESEEASEGDDSSEDHQSQASSFG